MTLPVVLEYLTLRVSNTWLPCSARPQRQRERAHELSKARANSQTPGVSGAEDNRRDLSVLHCKLGGALYQLPGMKSVRRKVRFEPVQLNGVVLHMDMAVQLQLRKCAVLEVCVHMIYCNCWPWLVHYTYSSFYSTKSTPLNSLAQIKPQALQNETTQRKSGEGSRRGTFIAWGA